MSMKQQNFSQLLAELSNIGIALSVERDHDRLLEMILTRAREMTGADGGTLYSRSEDETLRFEIMLTASLGIFRGGTSGEAIDLPPLVLYDADGQPNRNAVAAWAALSGETVNIDDAYTNEQFDFSGTREFDRLTGYRSQSFLTVPMTNHENEVIGVLQLINAIDDDTGKIRSFSALEQQLVEALASQAAVSITNRSLIEAQRQLFDSLIQLIASAIDEKSPYTAGHCRRVPELANMLADAACRTRSGPLADFSMTDQEKYELEVAAWLHDCGKITTPEFVIDKATKLETIFDRIELVNTRFAVLERDAEINALRRQLSAAGLEAPDLPTDPGYRDELNALRRERDFICRSNYGTESMSESDKAHIECIAGRAWRNVDGEQAPLLNDDEVQNLQIGRGTLTVREREIINNHVAVTIKMLESLPYPKHLRRVPEYAGGHHEKMDGSGYPNGLTREQMSVPARMLAIADVFEALTASDRPYKKAMPLSQALQILGQMKLDRHIDPDLFDAFMWNGVYMQYADAHLAPEQIDDVDLAAIPGYVPPGP
ncbi:HD-GYP domain-containing protein (c-di-GMP phosphodiesterase class II) [Methylohalomonas lacus]|uniref:HD-GYP domain-containing protein (C-di-GMP phosphodiesterase class II) n=1 Tax=Methylohalomonas lacus TaxID=398773 RepID=A0AAE3HNG6_9GAMM|nr:HD family phosphohydrolase [Methylohalomonas lacus]MCS3904561.1 HD-GYP domain-containing protein (c-di-GMP phosphodiesterase class II) [Methylohalomonas lacus]